MATSCCARRSLGRPRLSEVRVKGQAAVDEDRLPGDVGGVVGGEERAHAGHFVCPAGPAQRDVAGDHLRLDGVVDPRAVHRRDGGAGADAVDADATTAVLERERPGEVLHAALADAVPEVVRLGDDLVHARDVDQDARLVVGQESLDRFSCAQERAPQVDREDLVEVRGVELLGRSRELDAGVVDENVEAAEALGRLADHAHGVVLAGHVALDEDVADAVLLNLAHAGMHLLLGPCRLVGRGQVVDGDVGAMRGEAHGDRLPDPGRATGYQQILALQAGHADTAQLRVNGERGLRHRFLSYARAQGGAVPSTQPRCDGRQSPTRGCASAPITRADEPAAGGAVSSARAWLAANGSGIEAATALARGHDDPHTEIISVGYASAVVPVARAETADAVALSRFAFAIDKGEWPEESED